MILAVAVQLGCDYVHLGQEDLDHTDLPALRAARIKIGVSTHDETELQRALTIGADYVSLGPIYPTQLKIMPWAPQGLARLDEWKRAVGATPLVAIGGLTVERAASVLRAGADCVAMVTDVIQHPDPSARLRAWRCVTEGAAPPRLPARPNVLVVGGSDSSGGAGIQRDLRVLQDLSVHATCAITAITAQAPAQNAAIGHVPPELLRAQLEASATPLHAVKIGMLGSANAVHQVNTFLAHQPAVPVVLDPVLRSSSGSTLLDLAGQEALLARLMPRATLVTPNLMEAECLGQAPGNAAAEALLRRGARAVLLKGGHGEGGRCTDLLFTPDAVPKPLHAPRLPLELRGTGCALASAIAAQLSLGRLLHEACDWAKAYVYSALCADGAGAAPGAP